MGFFCTLFSVFIILGCSFDFCYATDSISSSQLIKDPETINSNGSLFTLGFFSLENSTNRYVGIWYKLQSEVLWIANRNQPLNDSSGIVTISEDGNLVVLNGQKQTIWSSNVSNITSDSTAQLLDSGNLVLLDNSAGKSLWQSFEHPSDTFLPTMKLTNNQKTGEKVGLTSRKSLVDLSTGNFFLTLERPNIPELFIWNGTRPYWRSGPWNRQVFVGIPQMDSFYLKGTTIVDDGEGTVYLTYTLPDDYEFTISALNSEGQLQERHWVDEDNKLQVNYTIPKSECDVYGLCGPYGSCNPNTSPICNCLSGFEPSNREEWNRRNWTGGCVRKTALQCDRVKNGTTDDKGDGFLKLEMVKVPDLAELLYDSEDTCRSKCLENCTCTAYSYISNIGCMSWRENLIDIQQFSTGGNDLHIRLAYSDLEKKRDVTKIIVISITVVITSIIIVVSGTYLLWKWIAKGSVRKRKSKWLLFLKRGKGNEEKTSNIINRELSRVQQLELLAYHFEKVAIATNNFDLSNKLGQGGFGPVYKGKLPDGQDIAVKRLSRASGQGLEEFMNEVVVISKLQHRNLVKLLGCCIEGEEKMLIYEYMPNKSLDAFIFDPPKHKLLTWKQRFDIIEGVARGILYLHRDSRLKIIHRDLKASNILLDKNLTPKISDFGMARIFGGNEDQANTIRVVGTYGYMSPEYAMEGLFSEKSDVFSFGVLLLEIVSGRKNSSFYNDDHSLSLIGFAWKLWNEENIVSLIDTEIFDPNLEKDILRCIHIGLLCVQALARERPSMSFVISMINSEIVNLPPPKQPAFIQRQSMLSSVSHEQSFISISNNSISITDIQGR